MIDDETACEGAANALGRVARPEPASLVKDAVEEQPEQMFEVQGPAPHELLPTVALTARSFAFTASGFRA